MASGNSWISSGASGPGGAQQTGMGVTKPVFDLRPLSTGEILDRTFQLYRTRFMLFAGLAMLPAGVSVITQSIRLWYNAHESLHVHHGADLYRVQIITGVMALLSSVISLILYGITQAATTWSVSAVYLGEPASIRSAYGVAGNHWFRYTLIGLRQIWAFMWLPLLLLMVGISPLLIPGHRGKNPLAIVIFLAFVSLIYAFWAYIRVSLAVPAAVVESLDVRGSIRRSKQLLVDRKARILLLLVFLFALYMVVGAIQAPLAVLALRTRGAHAFLTHAISLALSFVSGTIVGPIGAIAVCLFYIDERVRREGFDIEWMMNKVAPGSTAAPPAGPLQDTGENPAT
jgi:hypothetical protein